MEPPKSNSRKCVVCYLPAPNCRIMGHPCMTSTRRGRGSGSGGRMWTGAEVVKPHVDTHTKN